jgi:hypothetical protein
MIGEQSWKTLRKLNERAKKKDERKFSMNNGLTFYNDEKGIKTLRNDLLARVFLTFER